MKTAVEWLEDILWSGKDFDLNEVFNQAKEMEKEQMEKMYNHAMWALVDGNGHGESFEEHFNNTFNK
jgi:hypothetical protein